MRSGYLIKLATCPETALSASHPARRLRAADRRSEPLFESVSLKPCAKRRDLMFWGTSEKKPRIEHGAGLRGSFAQRYVKRHDLRPPFRLDFEVPGSNPAGNIVRRPSSRS